MSDSSNKQSSVEPQRRAEYVDGLPNPSGDEALIAETIADASAGAARPPLPGIRSRGSRALSRSPCTYITRCVVSEPVHGAETLTEYAQSWAGPHVSVTTTAHGVRLTADTGGRVLITYVRLAYGQMVYVQADGKDAGAVRAEVDAVSSSLIPGQPTG